MPIKISGTRGEKLILALLDEGSTVTLINEKIVDEIGAKRSHLQVALRGIGSSDSIVKINDKISLSIKIETNTFEITDALVVKNLELPRQSLSKEIVNFCHLRTGISINPYNATPDLLIGQDNCDLIITREFHTLIDKSLIVSRCILGWTIHGHDTASSGRGQVNFVGKNDSIKCKSSDENLESIIRAYFEFNAPEINTQRKYNSLDARVLKIFENTSRFCGTYWEIGLPWKETNLNIPNSRPTAFRRLQLLEKKLDRDPVYAKLYYQEMDRLLEKGYAKKVEKIAEGKRVWYLPHFGVQNANKPEKVRLVFDAAAKTAGISLNDMLLAGPDLLKPLPGVLMRHREFQFAIKGDYSDMFLAIKVRKEDRDAQRFLFRGSDRDRPPDEYVMEKVLFGKNSSPCVALYINNVNAERFKNQYPEAVRSIQNNCYMDDYLESCETAKEASERINEVIHINASAGWKMHDWSTNDPAVLKNVILETKSCELIKTEAEVHGGEKLLGLRWLCATDDLTFNINLSKIDKNILSGQTKPTKRQFLAIIMSVFDPLGFISPFTIKARILMQDIWTSGIGWDEQLCNKEFKPWQQWLRELIDVKSVRVNRCYQLKNTQMKQAELHVFSDASTKAYATVAYWRFLLPDNRFHVSLIMAKSRVEPLRVTTVPRLELQAAVLATQLARVIAEEHRIIISRRVFWSDSKTVLCWIEKDPREFKKFVANRVAEIRENTNVTEWRWVPTKENPADDGTRAAPDALKPNSRWLTGPSFLRDLESNWPISNTQAEKDKIDSERELKKHTLFCTTTREIPIKIDFSRFSSWLRVITVIVQVIKIIDIWKNQTKKLKNDYKYLKTPIEQRSLAELICIKWCQRESFEKEILTIKHGQHIPKDSRIFSLNPYLDDFGILRSDSRITKINNSDINTQPAILHAKNTATQLLIQNVHEKYNHANHETVINELRQKYWIIGFRGELRKIVFKCIVCKMLRAKPSNPQMAALPTARLAYRHRPFTHTGLDYFGPMEIKIGRRKEKRWGALFTCLTTRAIHIELAHSLSTDSAIMALRRFTARRGSPSHIYCDNGTNFRGMSVELKKVISQLDHEKLQHTAAKNDIDFVFNPPSAPHMGGAWERLVRSVKSALSTILKNQTVKEETLLTILVEIEHSINSRLLTHVSVDPRDSEALTPNHFLLGTSSGQIHLGRYDSRNLCMRKQWEVAQFFADQFWQRWLRDYLPSLIPRKKWQDKSDPLKIGDIVLILDNNLDRNQWRKGIISQIFPGSDGQVRVAEVKTANGIFLRPTRNLVKFAD